MAVAHSRGNRLRGRPDAERAGRRPRPDPRQGPGHRPLRARLARRDRAADHRRPDRGRERRHVPALRRGGRSGSTSTRTARKGLPELMERHDQRRRPRARPSGALEGVKEKAGEFFGGDDDDDGDDDRNGRREKERVPARRQRRAPQAPRRGMTTNDRDPWRAAAPRRRPPRRSTSTASCAASPPACSAAAASGARRRPVRRVEAGGLSAIVSDVPQAGGLGRTRGRGARTTRSSPASARPGPVVPAALRHRHGHDAEIREHLLEGHAGSWPRCWIASRAACRCRSRRLPTTRRCCARCSCAARGSSARSDALAGRPVVATQSERIALGQRRGRRGARRSASSISASCWHALSRAGRRGAPRRAARATGRPLPLSCLVEERPRPPLDAAVQRLADTHGSGCAFRYVGPIPPYSFCDLELDRRTVMGLVSGLLTLPLAPVRGVVLIAEVLAEEAERELDRAAIARARARRPGGGARVRRALRGGVPAGRGRPARPADRGARARGGAVTAWSPDSCSTPSARQPGRPR